MKKPIIVLCVIVATLVICILVAWSLKPSRAVIKPANNVIAPNNSADNVSLNTAYFMATLPTGFVVKTQTENATSQDVMQITAVKPNAKGLQIAISIGALPKEGLDGVASYNLRVKAPDTYTKTEFGGMPVGIPTFYSSSNSLYEITGFWVNGGLYAAISVSGIESDSTLINQTYAALLDTWKWK